MYTPILKPVFRKKVFQCHSYWKIIFWKNSAEMSNLALPARKSVKGVDANHLMFCLFSDTSSFMMFFSFSSAVLLLHDQTWPFAQRLLHFYERGGLELDLLPRDKIQDGAAKKICTIFSLSNLSAFVQKTSEWIVLLQNLKENSSWNLLCHRNTREMQQIFNHDRKQVAWQMPLTHMDWSDVQS